MRNFRSRVGVLVDARWNPARWNRVGIAALVLLLGCASLLLGSLPRFSVYTFDPYGNFKTRFASWGAGPTQLIPGQVAIDHNANVLIPDRLHGDVVMYDRYGNRKGVFGTGHLYKPFGIVVTSTGQILVSDPLRPDGAFIVRFDSTGVFLSQFNVQNQASTAWCPQGMALRSNGDLVVADCNGQVVDFDSLGNFRFKFGAGFLSCPIGVAIRAATGDTYVTDPCATLQIQGFDVNGVHKFGFGANGSGPGQLNSPNAVGLAPNGNVLVADTNNARMQEFDVYGNFLHFIFGNLSGLGQLNNPIGIAFQTDGTIVVTDLGGGFCGGCNAPKPPPD